MTAKNLNPLTYDYKGYTIKKALLFDGTDYVNHGWDVTKEGTEVYQAFTSKRAAEGWVRDSLKVSTVSVTWTDPETGVESKGGRANALDVRRVRRDVAQITAEGLLPFHIYVNGIEQDFDTFVTQAYDYARTHGLNVHDDA